MSYILMIEPEAELARLYSSALKAKGHKIVHVASAQEALFMVEKSRPETILLELDLPGHNGLEFLYEFSSYSDWSDIRVVVHTAQRSRLYTRMKVAWKDLRVTDYLYKPETSLATLQQTVS